MLYMLLLLLLSSIITTTITITTAWTLSSSLSTTKTTKAVILDASLCLMIHHHPTTIKRFAHHNGLASSTATSQRSRSRLTLSSSSSSSTAATQNQQDINENDNIKNQFAQDLFDFANVVGQVGSKTSDENQQKMVELANALIPYSDKAPARVPLIGTHLLQYSASPGGSSGQIGPLVGKVEQRFVDSVKFYNVVRFPPLGEVKLLVEREIMDDTRIKVKFVETSFMLFDKFTVKQFPVKGAGVWKQLFVGQVHVTLPGSSTTKTKILLRIMEAPSLFMIYQIL